MRTLSTLFVLLLGSLSPPTARAFPRVAALARGAAGRHGAARRPAPLARAAAPRLRTAAAHLAATRAAGEGRHQRAFVYLVFPRLEGGGASGADLGRMLGDVALSRLRRTEGIAVRTAAQMPAVARRLLRVKNLGALDRVALVALRTETGFDGYVDGRYRRSDDGVILTMRYVDFGNGRVFRVRTVEGPVSARLFTQLESDLVEFAATLRQTYRVTLKVGSAPAGARVTLNGREICRTPCTRELGDGSYRVEVRKRGYKPYRHRGFYKAGDRIRLHAQLYNPIADRYLNRAPALRVDSQGLSLGYRYMFFGRERPVLREAHLFNLEYLIRLGGWEAGVAFRASGSADVATPIASFVPELPASRTDAYRFLSPAAVFKRILFEKFSFLSVWAGASLGFVNARGPSVARWSATADAFLEVVSRLGRGKNFSFEAKLDVGFSYLGDLPWVEKTVSLFGDGPERQRLTALVGPFVGVSFRFIFWNGLF